MISAMIFDLDGTVYRGTDVLPGAVAFFAECKKHPIRTMFYTNRAHRSREATVAKLRDMGIQTTVDDVLTAARVTASQMREKRVFCVGTEFLHQELVAENATLTEDKPDCVVVGFTESFAACDLEKAARFIREGAAFIGTNPDLYILENGVVVWENGALLAAVEESSGQKPQICGKPNRSGIDLALSDWDVDRREVFMVGDNPKTDILCGRSAGVRTALTLTGITTAAEASQVEADWVVDGYADLWDRVFGPDGIAYKTA